MNFLTDLFQQAYTEGGLLFIVFLLWAIGMLIIGGLCMTIGYAKSYINGRKERAFLTQLPKPNNRKNPGPVNVSILRR